MSVHKLSAGDGYTYLTRQVAVADSTSRGGSGLSDYYSAKGESPGRWGGRGLAGVVGVDAGDVVGEAQMRALFGEGLHPDADALLDKAAQEGLSTVDALAQVRLGRAYQVSVGDQVVQREYRGRVGRMLQGWEAQQNVEHGMAPEGVRGSVRSTVARQMFTEIHHRPPLDGRELSGFQAQISRGAAQPVAGYDLTFSPVKSVSALWAIAGRDTAGVVAEAHRAAVDEAMAWVEDNAAFTRRGAKGVRHVDTAGLIWTRFDHRDSRAGDPDLHTHVAVSNKVQDPADGSWLALDGQVLYRSVVAASEVYNSALERQLSARLGVLFEPRDMGDGKRPVREIAGVPAGLCAGWSSRRADIVATTARLSDQFAQRHGRVPSPKEMLALYQEANLATRAAKHEPRSEAEQRVVWADQAAALLGGAEKIPEVIAGCTGRAMDSPVTELSGAQADLLAARIIEAVTRTRATFGRLHVRGEAERQVRALALTSDNHTNLVEWITARAMDAFAARVGTPGPEEAAGLPAAMRRRDGTSVWVSPARSVWTSGQVMDAERSLVAAAARRDGRVVARSAVDLALLEQMANGVTLNAGQARLVREFACSGARVQLGLAPAGTGKTTAMGVLRRAWESGGGTVIGLAPSAVAAQVLGADMGVRADTLAKLVDSIDRPGSAPAWMAGVGQGTLLVVDEAGMAGTVDLAHMVEWAVGRGASVRLLGDDRQLAAVGAGGVLRDIDATVGAVRLDEVMRFADRAEAGASVGLRGGDTAALGFYTDRGRVHAADPQAGPHAAYDAWHADLDAGLRSLLVAADTRTVGLLNARAQGERLLAHPDIGEGPSARLRGEERAWPGDVVVSRRNRRDLSTGGTDFVKNRDRWVVTAVGVDGSLDVTRLGVANQHVRLPADYVAGQVELGYATTVHGAQGMSVDTAHLVIDGTETRQHLYVGMTRGKLANHVWVCTGGDGDPHTLTAEPVVSPPSPVEALEAVLARDGAQTSATTAAREHDGPAEVLARLCPVWTDAVDAGTLALLTDSQTAGIDRAARTVWPGLDGQPAWDALRCLLARRVLDGADPAALLAGARTQRRFATPDDVAAAIEQAAADAAAPAGSPPDPSAPRPSVAGPLQDGGPGPVDPASVERVPVDGAVLDALAARVDPDLPAAPGWPVARARLAAAASGGADPAVLIRGGKDTADLAAVGDAAATLWWRLGGEPAGGPLDWLAAPPPALAGAPGWGRLLDGIRADIDAAEADLSARYRAALPADLPAWAAGLDHDRGLVARLAVWRAGTGLPETCRTPLGPRPAACLAADWWDQTRRVVKATRANDPAIGAWFSFLIDHAPATAADPFTADLAIRLAASGTPRTTLETMLTTTLAARPLPTEHPAAAWWYRIAGTLDHAAGAEEPGATADDRWVGALAGVLGPGRAAAVEQLPDWHLLADQAAAAAATAPVGRPAPDGPDLLADAAATAGITADTDTDEAMARIAWRLDDMAHPPADEDPGEPGPVDQAALDAYTAELHAAHDAGPAVDRRSGHTPTPASGGHPDAGTPPAARGMVSTTPREPQPEPDPPPVPDGPGAPRVLELNALAAQWWADAYPHSPAQDYLHGRFGSLADTGPWQVGYAPHGPAALTAALTAAGADPGELVDAGLSAWTRRGVLRDVFRDRLILAIRDGQGRLVGFTGRAIPGHAHPGAPKYLNTKTTPAFTKGAHLFGLAETVDILASGAAAVRVEGPMDAIAVTLAGHGRYAGLAPLGTALTGAQADLLAARTRTLLEATDYDTAGRKAAAHDYWTLAAAGLTANLLHVPGAAGAKDPADIWALDTGATLTAGLDASQTARLSLASRLIGDDIRANTEPLAANPALLPDQLDTTVRIIAALPPERRAEHVAAAAAQLADLYTDPGLAADLTADLDRRLPPHPTTQTPTRHATHQKGPAMTTRRTSTWLLSLRDQQAGRTAGQDAADRRAEEQRRADAERDADYQRTQLDNELDRQHGYDTPGID